MLNGQRFQFSERVDFSGKSSTMPYLPITLTHQNTSIEVMALLDTGASVNVLPYEVGLQLGAVWSAQTTSIKLSGNLDTIEARGLILSGAVAHFSSVLLAFAWTQARDVPIILGHMNFFAEFNVYFYRYASAFEVCPRAA